MADRWRVHAVLPRSRANGPGLRFVVWSQGCSLGCAGCFNPETHAGDGFGQLLDVHGLVSAALAERPALEGVTVTGGEPLEQPEAVAEFCRGIRAGSDLGIIVLTGFSRAEVESDAARRVAVAQADLVIAGRYRRRRRLARSLMGSDNKELWALTGRYSPEQLAGTPEVEVVIGTEGTVTVTGMQDGKVMA